MDKAGTTHNKRPYQYTINRKKRAIAERKGLESDEEEVEDLCSTKYIERILHTKYDRKTIGLRYDPDEGTPIHIKISVEPTTPCATKTSGKKENFRKPLISGRRSPIGQGTNGNSSGSMISTSSSQLSTPCIGHTTNFKMEGIYLTIRLPKFHGEGSEDPKKHLFSCENIWETK
jgi:hypothetical protein